MVSAILLALAFLCPLTGAAIGMALRHRIPEHHLTLASIDVMKLAMGLMATLVALTLGLLIQSASLYRTTVETEYRLTLASIVHLDEYLKAYGAGAREIREHVRHIAARSFLARWPDEDFGPTGPLTDAGTNEFTDVQRRIVELAPADAAQRWFQSQALQITNRLSDLRWLVLNQEATTAPLVPVFTLIFLSSIAICPPQPHGRGRDLVDGAGDCRGDLPDRGDEQPVLRPAECIQSRRARRRAGARSIAGPERAAPGSDQFRKIRRAQAQASVIAASAAPTRPTQNRKP